MSKEKNGSESTVATLSIVMLVMITAAVALLMMKNDSNTTAETSQQDSSLTPLPPKMERDIPALVATNPLPQPIVETASASLSEEQSVPLTSEEERMAEITTRFEQGIVMLHAKEYEHAATALHRVMVLSPRMPEVYVNMGYVKLGQKLYQEALVFFDTATQIKPEQANAYWGMAVAHENLEDLPAALGAMRTFIHLSPGDDSFLRRARSALWEWEETLARGPLPEEEKEFLERGALQWESRNTPRDDVDSGEQELQVQPIQ